MIKELGRLICASGALLAAKSALLGIRTIVLLIIAAYGRDNELAGASLALSLAEMGRWIADFGTDTWNVRAIAIAGSDAGEGRLVTAALLIKTVGSALVGLLILLICIVELPAHGAILGCTAAVLLITSQVSGLTISYFQAKDRIPSLVPMLLPSVGTVLATFLTLMLTRRTLVGLAVMTAGEIFIAAMSMVLLRRKVAFTNLCTTLPDARQMARSCIPTAIFGIIVGIYTRLDTVALAKLSFASLATYTVAQRLFLPFQIAVTSFGAIVYSRAVLFHASGRPFSQRLLRNEMPAILGCALACSTVLFFGGKLLVEHLFPQYRAALGALTVLCMSLPLLAFNAAMNGMLLGYGRYWSVLSVSILDLVLTCILMFVLAPPYGAVGTAECLLLGAVINGTALSVAATLDKRRRQIGNAAVDLSAPQ